MSVLTGRDLKFGDVVFIDGRSSKNWIGKAVRIVQRGGKHPDKEFCPNHIGVVIEENNDLNKVKVIQSAFVGVRIKELGLWTNHPKCNIEVKRYKGTFENWKRQRMKKWLYAQDGKPYDYFSLIGIFARYLLLEMIEHKFVRYIIHNWLPNYFDSKIKFICSELIFRAYQLAGVILWTETNPGFVTPYDIYKTKKLRTIGRKFNYEYGKDR
jgi:hypothetical protein